MVLGSFTIIDLVEEMEEGSLLFIGRKRSSLRKIDSEGME